MAVTGIKLDDGTAGFPTNCFPVRGLLRNYGGEDGAGAWLVAQKAEQRRRFKAVLCARPRTYSQIREERKKAQKEERDIVPPPVAVEDEEEEETSVLDGFFLMKHCCVEDPADLCSVNISGQGLSEVKEDDLALFDNVAYVNASENLLQLTAFRGFPIIRELELSLNGLRNIKVDEVDYPNLETLDLSFNNLSPEDLLPVGLLPQLRVLTLTGNGLSSLPPDLTRPEIRKDGKRVNRYKNLEVLYLDDNKLSELSSFAALAGLRKLKELNLDKNEIYCVPQLMLVEGRHVMTDTSSTKKRSRSVNSSRRSKNSSRKTPRASSRKEKSMTELGPPGASQTTDLTLPGVSAPAASCVTVEADEHTEEQESQTEDQGSQLDQNVTNAASSANSEQNNGKENQENRDADQKADDFNFDDLDLEDLNLGEFDAEMNKEPEQKGEGEEADGGLMPPPFPELRSLSLADNQIYEEEGLLAVAAWPMLEELIIHNNPLTILHSGNPPLLHRFLQQKLGISLVRKKPKDAGPPPVEVPQKPSRKVNTLVPRVPKRNIDEILLAIEGPKQDALPSPAKTEASLQVPVAMETPSPLPPITPNPGAEQDEQPEAKGQGQTSDADAFFMTQVDGQDEEQKHDRSRVPEEKAEEKPSAKAKGGMRKKKVKKVPDKYKGYEVLMDCQQTPELPMPKDIQGSVRALQYTLNHPTIYKDNYVELDQPQAPYHPYIKKKVPVSSEKKTKPELVQSALTNLRDRSTVAEAPLDQVLQQKKQYHKEFREAPVLLQQIQHRYNRVRATSMKEARDAKKLLQQTMAEAKSNITPRDEA